MFFGSGHIRDHLSVLHDIWGLTEAEMMEYTWHRHFCLCLSVSQSLGLSPASLPLFYMVFCVIYLGFLTTWQPPSSEIFLQFSCAAARQQEEAVSVLQNKKKSWCNDASVMLFVRQSQASSEQKRGKIYSIWILDMQK